MIASRASKTIALSSLVALTLISGMTPAVGTELTTQETAPPAQSPSVSSQTPAAQPSAAEPTAPAVETEPAPTEPAVVPNASADPAPESTLPAEPAPSSSVPAAPTAREELTPEDYANNPELLAELIGRNGAEMGQGLERIAVTGDPQQATPAESLMPEGSARSLDAAPKAAAAPAATNYWQPSTGVLGVDVSSHQGQYVNWNGAWNYGSRFAYVKATEALSYKNPYFGTQYTQSGNRGMIRGAYHFAIPNVSSGAAQANYFVANGGGWSPDGRTLPPLLDVEYNPYPSLGNTCYNMSASQMVNWIRDFSNRMVTLTGRKPMIYTTTDWWSRCTGNSSAFADHPLHVASYNNSGAGTLPRSWSYYSVWQYTSSGPVIGDWNQWNGSLTSLQAFARGSGASGSSGAIHQAWLRSGGANGPLGTARSSSDICGLHGGGCYRSYAGGNIYWTAATGAHAVTGAYWKAWGEAGWQMKIGYPTAGVRCGLHNGGCYQSFTGGNVYYHPSGGAHAVTGAYWKAWGEAGWQMKIGYPTAGVRCGLHNGGCYQSFTGGNVYYHPSGGAHAVTGAYWKAWDEAGWQMGTLGYPADRVRCGLHGGGCYQEFTGGHIYNTSATGANAVTQPYREAWRLSGWQMGRLGYPLQPAVASQGYRNVEFEGGWLRWTATGVQVRYK
ncbi:GH25 family lysozyme M1 (1,4-beta-N-acetylmuramidase) [Arthrobacter pigmenti]|uniref:lysozyme n=1 Tax=Arthrobacter pigmenti TaxID=271432 RepID=A0A846RP94_9MICC|nr:GH25 family lysozyme M1 (1,4-beta-N-acetylmuramidase) [Arthrobacter pigmenti]